MRLKSSGYSFLTDEKEALNYLTDNMHEIIKDLKKDFKSQVTRGKMYKGFRYQMFEDHIKNSIKQRLRQIYITDLKYDSEIAFVVQDDNDIIKVTEYIITQVLEKDV